MRIRNIRREKDKRKQKQKTDTRVQKIKIKRVDQTSKNIWYRIQILVLEHR